MGRRKVGVGLWMGNLKDRDHLQDSDLEWRIILRWIIKKWNGSIDWVNLAQDRDRWRALVNSIMNLLVL